MDLLVASGISIGILITGWAYIALGMPDLHLVVWAGVIAWATFYAAGGGRDGLRKTVASNLSGCFWAAFALLLLAKLSGGPLVLALLVGLVAFVICIQAFWAIFSFIPGAFLGAATWIGANGGPVSAPNLGVCVSLLAGAVLGYASEVAAKRLAAS